MMDIHVSDLLDQADEELEALGVELDEVDLSLQYLQDELAYAVGDISGTLEYVQEHLDNLTILLNRIRRPERPF